MRMLDVSPRVCIPPVRGGSQTRIYNLLLRLAANHEVRQFSSPRLIELRAPGFVTERQETPSYREHRDDSLPAGLLREASERIWVSAPVLTGIAARLTRPRALPELLAWADLTIVEFPWQFEHCLRNRPPGRPLVLATHNVEADKFATFARGGGARLSRRPWLAYIERLEANALANADLVLAVSDADRDRFSERYGTDPHRIVTVPNGADTRLLRPVAAAERERAKRALGLPPERPVVLYVGAGVLPNRLGLDWVRRVARLSDRFSYLVVGAVGGAARVEGNVTYTGIVSDLPPVFAAADISVCPLEYGGGTKIKLHESLAAGLPTVAFAQALHGMEIAPGEHVLVSEPDERALLDALERIAGDPGLAARLGRSGRRFIEERRSWDANAARLDAAVRSLVREAAAGPVEHPLPAMATA